MHHATAILFDLDGTLLNTLSDLRNSLNYALAAHHLPTRTLSQVRHDVGNGVRVLVERSITDAPDELVDSVLSTFRPYYAQHALDTTLPYPGILDMLSRLRSRGTQTAIVSNKPDAQVRALHERFFPDLIDTAIGEQQPLVQRKPAPDMVNIAMLRLHALPAKTVYVGDSEVDLQTAANARIPCIACTWGFRTRGKLLHAGATTLIDSPEQLDDIL